MSSGRPKGIELYAIKDISDLSVYGIGVANNGGDTDGVEYTLSGSASAGDYIHIIGSGYDDSFYQFFGISSNILI